MIEAEALLDPLEDGIEQVLQRVGTVNALREVLQRLHGEDGITDSGACITARDWARFLALNHLH